MMHWNWNQTEVSALIKLYYKEEVLYVNRHPQYHNKRARLSALQKIVEDIRQLRPHTTIDHVKMKIHGLRTQFRKEQTRLKCEGAKKEPKTRLWCFDQLAFLDPHTTVRKSFPVLSSVSNCVACNELNTDNSYKQETTSMSSTTAPTLKADANAQELICTEEVGSQIEPLFGLTESKSHGGTISVYFNKQGRQYKYAEIRERVWFRSSEVGGISSQRHHWCIEGDMVEKATMRSLFNIPSPVDYMKTQMNKLLL
ncbi:hypothetical protein FQA39_LY07651 [Lamprigera yunnana]|nr:hypothetical protein FQA39_LY07651 [Lamprigera yunnana]